MSSLSSESNGSSSGSFDSSSVFSSIDRALDELTAGKPVLVADNTSRENEIDAIMPAQFATAEWIGWFIRYTSGYLCAPMTKARADALDLPLMTTRNRDPRRTAYTISVDAAKGVTTGISAHDRAATVRTLADHSSTRDSIVRPGHILPLRAQDGGVRQRAGHTEAAVDLMRAAGLTPVGVIGELVHDDGSMSRRDDLATFTKTHGLVAVTITDLITWLNDHDVPPLTPSADRVTFAVETTLPTAFGTFAVHAYHDRELATDHLALIHGPLDEEPIVRVHSECLTGETFGSLRCECGPQLQASMELIAERGGMIIYLRGHEGRGIGLVEKLRAYALQDDGLDTLDANLALGHQADEREYGGAAAILQAEHIARIRLLTNNPQKVTDLQEHGVDVVERIPLVVGENATNANYLHTKRDRMGHLLP